MIYLYFLLQVPEPKDLVIDPQLMKPLDHFTGASFLKVNTACHVVLSLVFNLFAVIVLCVAGLSELKQSYRHVIFKIILILSEYHSATNTE